MKKFYGRFILSIAIILIGYGSSQAQLTLSAVFDGPLTGGVPKGVEIYVSADIPDLSIYGLGSANNGGGSDGEEFNFPAVSVTAGDYIYVASESTQFTNYFGFAPDYTSGAMSINGDDAIELFKNGVVADVFGEIDIDGSGTAWEYMDGWAYRNASTGPDGSVFTIGNWTLSGINAIDGCADNASCSSMIPVGTYLSVTPITDANFQMAITTCLSTNPVDGLCYNSEYGAMPDWDVSAVTDMALAFKDRANFNADISAWDVSGVTNMNRMFANATAFNQDIGSWDVSKVTNMIAMFSVATSFNQDIGGWDVGQVLRMDNMFDNASAFNQNIGSWDVGNVTNMRSMFRNTPFNQDIGSWDVGQVLRMDYMFLNASAFNQDIGFWDVSQVTKMERMFEGSTSFNQDIGSWDVTNVTSLKAMFKGATSFNQYIGDWVVTYVTNMQDMFNSSDSFNQDISSWDVSNVSTMFYMFGYASSFNQDLSNWDVSNVEIMGGMFNGATSFNQPVGTWDVSNVENMGQIFQQAWSFNQDLSNWDVSSVTNMVRAFEFATSFNQNLGNWDVSNVTEMGLMLSNSGLSIENYDSTIIDWSNKDLQINVNLGANGLNYCSSEIARQSIIDNFGWTINDAGLLCLNPTAVCQDITIELDQAGQVTISAIDVDNGSTDSSGGTNLTYSVSPSSFDCSNVGPNVVTLTVTDVNGNSSTCEATVTVEDNLPLVVNCPDDITVDTDPGVCEAVVTYEIPEPTDNCGGTSEVDIPSGSIFDVGTTTVTVSAPGSTPIDSLVETFSATTSSNNGMVGSGVAVSDDGNTIAYSDRTGTCTTTVYEKIGGVWTQKGSSISGVSLQDSQRAIGMSANGNRIVTGAQYYPASGLEYGLLRVYDWDGTDWVQLGSDIVGTSQDGELGVSLAMSDDGTYFIAGGFGGGAPLGNAYVYKFDGTDWVQHGQTIIGVQGNGWFGISVDMSADGSSVVVGQRRLNNRFMVYDFDTASNQWVQRGPDLLGSAYGINVGTTVTMSADGNTVASGGPETTVNLAQQGGVVVLDWDGSSWVQKGPVILGGTIYEYFGSSLGLSDSGDKLYAGSQNYLGNNVQQNATGRASLMAWDGTSWNMIGNFVTGNGLGSSNFGQRGNISGDASTIVVGGILEDSNGYSNNGIFKAYDTEALEPLECTFTVTVEDNEAPDAVCADITIQLDENGEAFIVASDLDGGSTDNCGIDTTSLKIPEDDQDWNCDEVGEHTVTLTLKDVNGNISTCDATVTVEDNIAPIAVCQDVSLELDENGMAVLNPDDLDGGSTDNCGIQDFTISAGDLNWGCSDVGDNTVTLIVVDNYFNVSTCTATVTVEDNVDPEAVCQNISIQLDADGNAVITAEDIDGGSTDVCGIASLSIDSSDEDWGCDEVGSNTVTLTVTDTNGNESSCNATVTVEDNVDPEAVCQNISIQLDENGNASITAVDINGGSADACGVVTISIDSDDEDWGCDEVGSNTVTLTVTDTNGNESSCNATVTVEDNVDPEAVCQDITIQLDADGNASITAVDIDGGSTDACGIASLAIDSDDEDWGCDEVGSNTATLTVTDTNGNESSCDATVTVEDNVAPEAVCQDITIQLDENGEVFIVAVDIDGGSNDACGIESISITADDEDWNCDEVGENTVTLTVSDINGNTSSCDAIVTVEDNIPPALDCPDVVINLDPGLCGQVVQYAIETSDNCGVDSEVLIDGPASETYLDYHDSPWSVTWEVTDVNGNLSSCTFTITMNEYSNPTETLVCNDLVNIALDEDGCSEIGADMLLEGGPYGCYDDYIVDINFEGAEVCCEDIDETLYYTVTDPDTGNSCSGYIEVYDAIGPYCDFEEEIVVSCIDEIPSPEDTQSSIGFYDNCGVESIFLVSEELEDDDICDSAGEMVIVRIWGATDESGNAATELCEQHIVIEREDVFFPADATFDCASYTLDDLDPSLTGYPTAVQSSACAYEYNYSDVVLPSCGGLSQIVRTWTVLDICTDQIITTDANGTSNVQIIELIDTDGPSIDASEMTLYTDSDQCAFTGFIAAPSISDNCTGVISVQMFIDGLTELVYVYDGSGIPIGGYVEGAGMELGTYTLSITATDACGNISTAEVDVTIEDDVTPTAICDEITQVALESNGTAEVFAETFDDGSHDNCCLEGFDVRRMDGAAFGATVSFDCADIGATTQVILRVHDCHGNTNSCMVEVLVEDKIAPYLAVPAGTEISCEDYFANIAAELDNGNGAILDDMFGVATFGDNCEAILDYSYTYGVDQCGEGSITRSWTVNDPSGNGPVSGTQTITIYHVSDWSISFPGDLDATCVDGELPDFGQPTISGDDCEMIAVSHTDTQYDVVPDACYKIVREWSAINWCTYPDEAAITATQVIKVTDDEAPIFDVEDFTVEITEADCDVAVTLPTPDVTDCSDDITIETSSDLPAGEAGPGTYTATYTVSDGCGNFSYDVITITVVDAKKPTPYVTDHLVTEIMQTGMTQLINVNDYDIGSFDNCSDVVLSFSPDVTDTEVQFTCDDIGENTLEIWVTDEAGNQDFVTVTMEVQDNMEACGPGSLTVAGALHTSDEQGIEDATVDINGGLFTQVTDETGTFGFDLETGGDYSVVPSLDLNASNGVTTYDIVLVTQHILGMNPFTDPLNLIAADANNSNTVTTLDVVAIRMVILQITDAFPNNTSWRFVDKDHVFTDPTNPWDFPEVVNINNLDEEMLDVDFTGIKIGDVNGSAQANFMSPAENRTSDAIQIDAVDKLVQAGQEVTVSFTTKAAVSGYQFTLNHNDLELVSVNDGLATAEHFGIHNGAITASWNDLDIRNLRGEELFSVTFKALADVQLSEALTINSRYTQAEAYTTQGIEGVELTFSGQANTDYVLYQNVPNPFNGQTTIGFDLAKAGQASLTIMTIDGQTVKSINGDFAAGYNEVIIKDLNAVGVLYYSLESGDFTATKKMIVIK